MILSRAEPTAVGAGPDVARSVRRWRVVAFVVHSAAFAPLTVQAVYHPDRWPGPDDFTTHIRVVIRLIFRRPWEPGAPHFLWHLLVKIASALLPGSGYLLGAAVVTTAFAGLTGVVWFEVLRTGAKPRLTSAGPSTR